MSIQEVVLAQPRGFCAGVDRAITIVEAALKKWGPPIYVRHEIVHNSYVVAQFKDQGVVFIDSLAEVPPDATLIFSAHGVSQAVQEEAQQLGLRIFDATCPLVTKVHVEVSKLYKEGYEFILIGHKGHPEVEGTMGQLPSSEGPQKIHLVETVSDVSCIQPSQTTHLALVTQTTLSVDDTAAITAAIRERFPHIRTPKLQDICYATQNRQDAIKTLAQQVDVVLVVGSPTSSNSNRLAELAQKLNIPSYLIEDASMINPAWLEHAKVIGLSAGASAPEFLVQAVVHKLKSLGAIAIRTLPGKPEDVHFPLPKGLR
jgi:4-hydroxy-3-methylbut-2-enyl diphosphate reductase